MAPIPTRVKEQVAARANYRCEYCHSPQIVTAQPFHADHITPRSKGGATTLENLCYACPICNLRKRNAVAALDPETGEATPLFHPRQHLWSTHFAWSSNLQIIVPLTPVGRATVHLLQLNDELFMRARQLWVQLQLLP